MPISADYDVAWINAQTSSDLINVGGASDGPWQMYFNGNGNGYTVDQTPSTGGALNFINWYSGTGIYVQSTLAGNGEGETINVPITSAASSNSGPLWLNNWSPVTQATPALVAEGVAGYNNTLTVGGPITMTSTGGLDVEGIGNVNITGNFTSTYAAPNQPTSGYTYVSDPGLIIDTAAGTTTLSGANSWTGYTKIGGNVVFDYTTNNTQGFSPTAQFDLGAVDSNYNGNVSANGGNLTIKGNAAGTTLTMGTAGTPYVQYYNNGDPNQPVYTDHVNGYNYSDNTTQYVGGTYFSGSSSLLVEGSTTSSAPSAATNVYLGFINANYSSATDITTTGNANVYTNSTDDGIYGAQVGILGQFLTYDKSYWATVNEYAYQGTTTYNNTTYNTYFQSGTPLLIQGLYNDNGTTFDSQWADFHVANEGASDVQVLNGANYEGADTIRFTSANDPLQPGQTTPDVNSAHTLDLGGGNLYMVYGGIMVTQNVTGDTEIKDGTLNGFLEGLSIINYSSGTLTISANIQGGSFGINGGGTVVLSGNNDVGEYGQGIYLNAGKTILGSNTALGTDNEIDLADPTTILDLAGYSTTISKFQTSNNNLPGNAAALAGLNADIINSKAGTISTITVEGNAGTGDNGDPNNPYSNPNLGWYYGGLNEVSGSIIALNIQQGATNGGSNGTNQVEMFLGTADGVGDQSGANTNNIAGIEGAATQITGAITIGKYATLGLQGYGDIETMGVTTVNGIIGANGQQAASYGTTYLTGTGLVSGGGGWGFDLNTVGSVADTFNGNFGTAANNAGFNLIVGGGGTVDLTNAVYSGGLTVTGLSHVTTPGLASNASLTVSDGGDITLTGTGGVELGGNQPLLYGGTVNITPTDVGGNILVTGANSISDYNQLQLNGASAINLDRNGNTSVTLQLGATSGSQVDGNFYTYWNYQSELEIGSAQGLSELGGATGTDKFIIVAANGLSSSGFVNQNYSIVHPWIVGVNQTAGSSQDATFLTYEGTGTTSDNGFTAYDFATAGNVNNLAGSTHTSAELITDAETLQNYTEVYALEIDKGGSLNTNGQTLAIGNYNGDSNEGGLILNGASISGAGGISLNRSTSIYTDLDGGSIENLSANNQDISTNGPGTLEINHLYNAGNIAVNQGVLDLGGAASSLPNGLILNGGVLQGTGTLADTLSQRPYGSIGSLDWEAGGFSARGVPGVDSLTVVLNYGANLVWGTGGTSGFLGQGAAMQFGSASANDPVYLQNNVDLGVPNSGNQGGTALYSRIIDVTANSADAASGLDPFDYLDYAQLNGVVSSSNPYEGLSKTGNGVLYLIADNTYTGATMIAGGTLEIYSDSNLGTAPTAAYAINTAPGLNGGALTPGAVEINGGAALGVWGSSPVVLNANRQILLASGATGATPSIIDVDGNAADGYSELDFGGVIADYVGEVGSLEKAGGGIFNYSGTSANTGADSVVAGTFEVSGSGSVNSASGVTINNQTPTSGATFNYGSTVGLSKAVTYGAGGGTFAYNSGALYTGSTSLVVGAKDTLAGGVGGLGNLSHTDVTIGTGGTILPGSQDPSPGQLTVGKLSLMEGGNYNFLLQNAQLAGLPPDAQYNPVGPGYSTVVATSLDLSGLSSSNPFNINLESLSAPLGQAADRFYFYLPYTFTLVSTTDGITGAFDAADFDVITDPNNGTTGFDMLNGGQWTVAESSNGDNLLLEYTPTQAPEPSTWALLLGGLGLLGFCVRRARRQSA